MVRTDDGRLLQTSGPQTANASRPKSERVRRMTAARVDAERRNRRFVSDVWKAKGRQSTTDNIERWLGAWTPRLWTGRGTWLVACKVHGELEKCSTDGPVAEQDVQQHSAHARVAQMVDTGRPERKNNVTIVNETHYQRRHKLPHSFLADHFSELPHPPDVIETYGSGL